MMDFGFNMPLLTDEGAKALGKGAGAFGERLGERLGEKATENLIKIVPSQRTTLLIAGGLFILSSAWLVLSFYREVRKGDSTKHTVEHHNFSTQTT